MAIMPKWLTHNALGIFASYNCSISCKPHGSREVLPQGTAESDEPLEGLGTLGLRQVAEQILR